MPLRFKRPQIPRPDRRHAAFIGLVSSAASKTASTKHNPKLGVGMRYEMGDRFEKFSWLRLHPEGVSERRDGERDRS